MTHRIHATVLAIAVATLGLTSAHAATLGKADYSAEKTRISADYKAAKSACDAMKANAKDVCVEEAKGKEKVARAELEFRYTGKEGDNTKLRTARADAAYAVAKERCDDQAGDAKDLCVKEAKTAQTKANADAKMARQVGEARSDATQSKADADYKLAAERCDALSGDAKTGCMNSAKAKFGKN